MKDPLTLIDKAFLLKKNAFFSALDIDHLLTIADKMESESYKKGTTIFQKNHAANRVYLLVEGVVSVKKEGGVLAELGALDLFGDEAVLSEKARGYDAFCQTDVVALSLTATHLLAIIAECPAVATSLLEAYAAPVDFRVR
jgi:CRP/FNR family cyclic AMP-dependent transcriptional regulator